VAPVLIPLLNKYFVRFEVLTLLKITITVFCNVTPYSLVDRHQSFEETAAFWYINTEASVETAT
jgi:hypothetical protein